MTHSISAVIITLNEEKNIANAILSVRPWVQEVVVVDMSSNDKTQDIARSLGASVHSIAQIAAFDGARAIGVERAGSEWILLLDADEVIPEKLGKRLIWLTTNGSADAYTIPRLNYFSGTPLLHTGFGPITDRQLRFYRYGAVRLTEMVHGFCQVEPGRRLQSLDYDPDACIVHFNHKNSSQFIEKLNKYTMIGAVQKKDSLRFVDRSLFIVPLAMFLNHYVRKAGFRDGWRGFYYSFMAATYRMTQTVKIRELKLGCDDVGSARIYQEIARDILSKSTGFKGREP